MSPIEPNPTATLLVIDDDAAECVAIQDALVNERCRFVFADAPDDARRHLEHTQPDVILLAAPLQGLECTDVCMYLRSSSAFSDIPIIVMSLETTPESRSLAIEAGVSDFLARPIDRIELRARTRNLVCLSRYQRSMGAECDRYLWIMDQSSEGYILLDVKNQLVFANATARQLLGLPPWGDLPSTPFHEHLRNCLFRIEPTHVGANWGWRAVPPGEDVAVRLVPSSPQLAAPVEATIHGRPVPGSGARLVTLQGPRNRRMEGGCGHGGAAPPP